MSPKPPVAPQKPHSDTRHGESLSDPYHWLKDPDWQQVLQQPSRLAGEIRTYLEAENAYGRAMLADTAGLQVELLAELKGRIKEDDVSVPLPHGRYDYYYRYEQGAQYPRYLRRPRLEASASKPDTKAEELLLNIAQYAYGHAFYRVLTVRHSPDHKRIAYAVDPLGSERYEIRVHDLTNCRALLPDIVTGAGGNFIWCADGLSFCYIAVDANLRPKEVRRHRLGQPPSDDELLYREPDDGFFLRLGETSSQSFITLTAYDHASSEVHVLDAHDPRGRFRCVEPRQPAVIYELSHHGEFFYLTVHAGEQKDGCIVLAPVRRPGRANWLGSVPYQAGTLIEGVVHFAHHMVRLETADALPRLVVTDLASGAEHSVAFSEEAYALGLVTGYEFATTKLRFTFSSLRQPEQTWEYDLVTRQRQLLKQQEVPSGHDPERYELRRLVATARDGALIPITLLRRRGSQAKDAPLLLYGYGSYGISMPVSFMAHRLSLVDRGIGFAVAHIRGGKERGYGWYEGAKLQQKQHTFTDFIDAAEWLIAAGHTARGRILAQGASAGGMLMGVVANMAPQLFAAIIAEVPFVDVLNTMWDATLPLTPPEWLEWGNPILDAAAHAYIRSYSPYDNIRAQAYPPMLVLAGLTDPRVTYWEPAKWVARLRQLKTDDQPLLFQVNMDAGHAGASGRFDSLHKVALIYAFALKILGREAGGKFKT